MCVILIWRKNYPKIIFTWKQQLKKYSFFTCGPPKWVVTSCLCSKWIRRILTPIHIILLTVSTHPSLSTWFLDSYRPTTPTRPLTIIVLFRRPPVQLQSILRLRPFTSIRLTGITVLLLCPILNQLRHNSINNNNCRPRQPQVIILFLPKITWNRLSVHIKFSLYISRIFTKKTYVFNLTEKIS